MIRKIPILIGLIIFVAAVSMFANYQFTNQDITKVPIRIDANQAVSMALNLKLSSNGLSSVNKDKNISIASQLTQAAKLDLTINQVTSGN